MILKILLMFAGTISIIVAVWISCILLADWIRSSTTAKKNRNNVLWCSFAIATCIAILSCGAFTLYEISSRLHWLAK